MSDQVVAGAASHGVCRLLVVVAAGDGQEDLGAGDLDGRCGLGPGNLAHELPLVVGQFAERGLLESRHRPLLDVRSPRF